MLMAELVCQGCHRILCHPYGAVSCRCRHCNGITPAQYVTFPCGGCHYNVVVPLNTTCALCPVCTTVTDIPEQYLPIFTTGTAKGCGGGALPLLGSHPDDDDPNGDVAGKTMYVSYEMAKRKKGAQQEGNANPLGGRSSSAINEPVPARHPVMLIGKRII